MAPGSFRTANKEESMKVHAFILTLVVIALVWAFSPALLAQQQQGDIGSEVNNEVEYAIENFWTSEEGLESTEEIDEGLTAEENKETTEEIREAVSEHLGDSGGFVGGLIIVIRKTTPVP